MRRAFRILLVGVLLGGLLKLFGKLSASEPDPTDPVLAQFYSRQDPNYQLWSSEAILERYQQLSEVLDRCHFVAAHYPEASPWEVNNRIRFFERELDRVEREIERRKIN